MCLLYVGLHHFTPVETFLYLDTKISRKEKTWQRFKQGKGGKNLQIYSSLIVNRVYYDTIVSNQMTAVLYQKILRSCSPNV